MKSIILSGGEPTLHPSFNEYIKIANDNGIRITLITNLSYDKVKYNEFLINNNLQITFDSIHGKVHDIYRGNGNYSRLCNFLKENSQYMNNIKIRFNLKKDNIKELDEIENFTKKNGIKNINFNYINNTGRGSTFNGTLDIFDIKESYFIQNKINYANDNDDNCKYSISNVLAHTTCPLTEEKGLNNLCPRIDYMGNIYLCQAFSKRTIGNIYEEEIEDIIAKFNFKINEYILENRKVRGCKKCFYFNICKGGCLSKVESDNSIRYCKLYKNILLHLIVKAGS